MKKITFSISLLSLLLLISSVVSAREINTFYGTIDIEEPVVLELIDSAAFQRLKEVRQYGVGYYTTHDYTAYTRFDHSLGVFALLRKKGCSLEEQIAGLLHDVSHTAFSHVGDWVFEKENQDKDYQNSIHVHYLEESGLGTILQKYGYTSADMDPTQERYPALECPSPDLCADRIDYNIQGAFYEGFITHNEAREIFDDLQFVQGAWISTKKELMKTLVRSSLYHTLTCWGSPESAVTSRWLADALLRGIEIGMLTYHDLHFGTDQDIWERLLQSRDHVIAEKMYMLQHYYAFFTVTDAANGDFMVKSKFRGINPKILTDRGVFSLTEIDPEIRCEFQNVKTIVNRGFAIKQLPCTSKEKNSCLTR